MTHGRLTQDGQGIVVGTGVNQEPRRGFAPAKVPGRHRWIAVVTHTLSDEAARRGHAVGAGPVLLDVETMLDMSIGCLDCEQPFHDVADEPCRASAYRGFDRAV